MANKTITLSSQQYNNLIELIHEERDDAGCQLNSTEFVYDRASIEKQYANLCELSQIIYEQCE